MKAANIFSAITLAMMASAVALSAYWVWYPFVPITVPVQPYKLHSTTVKRGNHVTWTTEYCRYTNVRSIFNHELVGKTRTNLNSIHINLRKAGLQIREGCGEFTKSVHVPDHITPGKYHMEITAFYQVNPLRVIRVELKTEDFEVIE